MKNTTPEQLLTALIRMFPSFQAHWDEDDNLFRDDGVYTVHGVFSLFSWYVRDHFAAMSEAKRVELAQFAESCISDDDTDLVDNAVCTCFLENLAGEPPANLVRLYLLPKSLAYFSDWDN